MQGTRVDGLITMKNSTWQHSNITHTSPWHMDLAPHKSRSAHRSLGRSMDPSPWLGNPQGPPLTSIFHLCKETQLGSNFTIDLMVVWSNGWGLEHLDPWANQKRIFLRIKEASPLPQDTSYTINTPSHPLIQRHQGEATHSTVRPSPILVVAYKIRREWGECGGVLGLLASSTSLPRWM